MNLIGRVAECRELKRLKFVVFVTSSGMVENGYTKENVNGIVALEDLF